MYHPIPLNHVGGSIFKIRSYRINFCSVFFKLTWFSNFYITTCDILLKRLFLVNLRLYWMSCHNVISKMFDFKPQRYKHLLLCRNYIQNCWGWTLPFCSLIIDFFSNVCVRHTFAEILFSITTLYLFLLIIFYQQTVRVNTA